MRHNRCYFKKERHNLLCLECGSGDREVSSSTPRAVLTCRHTPSRASRSEVRASGDEHTDRERRNTRQIEIGLRSRVRGSRLFCLARTALKKERQPTLSGVWVGRPRGELVNTQSCPDVQAHSKQGLAKRGKGEWGRAHRSGAPKHTTDRDWVALQSARQSLVLPRADDAHDTGHATDKDQLLQEGMPKPLQAMNPRK